MNCNILCYFWWLLFFDNAYALLWYFKARLSKQDVVLENDKLTPTQMRYSYLGVVAIVMANVDIILYTNVFAFHHAAVLAFPIFTKIVCEHYMFELYYQQVHQYFTVTVSHNIAVLLCKLVNAIGSSIMAPKAPTILSPQTPQTPQTTEHKIEDRKWIYEYEVILYWNQLSAENAVALLRSVIIGLIYDYTFHYYNITYFQPPDADTKAQLYAMFYNRQWDRLLEPTMMSKLFSLYHHNNNSWLYRYIVELHQSIRREFTIIMMYWTLVTILNYTIGYAYVSAIIGLIIAELDVPNNRITHVSTWLVVVCGVTVQVNDFVMTVIILYAYRLSNITIYQAYDSFCGFLLHVHADPLLDSPAAPLIAIWWIVVSILKWELSINHVILLYGTVAIYYLVWQWWQQHQQSIKQQVIVRDYFPPAITDALMDEWVTLARR